METETLRMDYSLKWQKARIGFIHNSITLGGREATISFLFCIGDTWNEEHKAPDLLLIYRKDKMETHWDNKELGN